MIWKLRERHLQKDLQLKYVFYLLCCYQSDCVHPMCKKGKPDKEPCWFPGGPPLTYVPVPTPDPERPFGNPSCSHLQSEKLWQHVGNGGALSKASPPVSLLMRTLRRKQYHQRILFRKLLRKFSFPLPKWSCSWNTCNRFTSTEIRRRKGSKNAERK